MKAYRDSWYTFRFKDDRTISRFHLEGILAGQNVSVIKIAATTGERLGLVGIGIVGGKRLGGLGRADHRAGW